MIEIGGKPILWHILKIYSHYGINDFVICCGYKGHIIKEYFEDLKSKSWNVQTIDTGLKTMTGGRLKRIENEIDDTFCMTYGDDLKAVDISKLLKFHTEQKNLLR